jgi:hypothetical protein
LQADIGFLLQMVKQKAVAVPVEGKQENERYGNQFFQQLLNER